MNNSSFFISGTDTDIGKTYTSSLIFKSLIQNKNETTKYYKPVQSGCFLKDNTLTAPDLETVSKISGVDYSQDMCTYYLEPEVSPHLAAEIENTVIDPEKIISEIEKRKAQCDNLIVEGAGGIFVPIVRDKFYIYDLIKSVSLPVILTAGTKVGSINHTMLTVKFLESMNIKIQGIVFNKYTGKNYEDDNIRVILKDSGITNYLIINENQKDIDYNTLKKFLSNEKKDSKEEL